MAPQLPLPDGVERINHLEVQQGRFVIWVDPAPPKPKEASSAVDGDGHTYSAWDWAMAGGGAVIGLISALGILIILTPVGQSINNKLGSFGSFIYASTMKNTTAVFILSGAGLSTAGTMIFMGVFNLLSSKHRENEANKAKNQLEELQRKAMEQRRVVNTRELEVIKANRELIDAKVNLAKQEIEKAAASYQHDKEEIAKSSGRIESGEIKVRLQLAQMRELIGIYYRKLTDFMALRDSYVKEYEALIEEVQKYIGILNQAKNNDVRPEQAHAENIKGELERLIGLATQNEQTIREQMEAFNKYTIKGKSNAEPLLTPEECHRMLGEIDGLRDVGK